MLKSPNILDIIGLLSLKLTAMVNQKDKKSGLTDGSSRSLSGWKKKPALYFCWKEETAKSPVFQKMLNSIIAPGANTAYREHNNILV